MMERQEVQGRQVQQGRQGPQVQQDQPEVQVLLVHQDQTEVLVEPPLNTNLKQVKMFRM